jgi:hypothetical protein
VIRIQIYHGEETQQQEIFLEHEHGSTCDGERSKWVSAAEMRRFYPVIFCLSTWVTSLARCLMHVAAGLPCQKRLSTDGRRGKVSRTWKKPLLLVLTPAFFIKRTGSFVDFVPLVRGVMRWKRAQLIAASWVDGWEPAVTQRMTPMPPNPRYQRVWVV